MGYKIIISPRAFTEIKNAIDYYSLASLDAPQKFIFQLESSYSDLKINPFKRIRYKNIRAIKLKIFPHYLYFVVNEKDKIIKILACFHGNRNPKKRPRVS